MGTSTAQPGFSVAGEMASACDALTAARCRAGQILAGMRLADGAGLDRHVIMFGQGATVGPVLARPVTHISGVAGEIAAAKRLQGVRRLPF